MQYLGEVEKLTLSVRNLFRTMFRPT